jgi:Major intrinsic protein
MAGYRGVMIMKATSMSPGSGQRTASSSAAVFLHGHQLDRNLARAAVAEAVGTFVLVLAITSAAVATALSRPVAGAPHGSLAVPVADGLALAIGVAGVGHISGAHLNPAVTLALAVNRHFPWAYAPGYVIAQFAGATAAAAVTWALYGNQARSIAALGAPAPAAGFPRGRCSRPKPLSPSCWSWWSWRWPPTPGSRGASLPWPSARPRGRHRDQRTGQRRGRQPGPGDQADDPGRPVPRLVGIPRGAVPALTPLWSHATARPGRPARRSKASPAGGGRRKKSQPTGTSQRYDLTHCHPGQAASSTGSLNWAGVCAGCHLRFDHFP